MKQIIFSTIILLTICGCTTYLPEDELRLTRGRLRHHLQHEAMTQSEMNIISAYIFQLADMEKNLIEYRIVNQPNYNKIEKAFLTDCEAWKKLARKEAETPSRYEGGSFAPMDHHSQMTDLVETRIRELKIKWRKK